MRPTATVTGVYEPQGPLPTEVYWRRRLVAIALGVLAVAAVVTLIVVIAKNLGSGDKPAAAPAAAVADADTDPAPTDSPASEPADPNADAEPAEAAAPAEPNAGGGESPAPEAAPPAAAPAAQTDVPPCSDGQLSVVLYTDKPTYTRGDQPIFTIVLTNGGLGPCSRDVGKAAQNVVVRSLDGARTLWTATDCGADTTTNIQVLQPGQQVRDEVRWSFTTSNPGCNRPRNQIPVGAYKAIAKFGERESAPVTFNVVAPAEQ